MDKTKIKNNRPKQKDKKQKDITKNILKKIDSLSWEMGEKKYSVRQELYDR